MAALAFFRKKGHIKTKNEHFIFLLLILYSSRPFPQPLLTPTRVSGFTRTRDDHIHPAPAMTTFTTHPHKHHTIQLLTSCTSLPSQILIFFYFHFSNFQHKKHTSNPNDLHLGFFFQKIIRVNKFQNK